MAWSFSHQQLFDCCCTVYVCRWGGEDGPSAYGTGWSLSSFCARQHGQHCILNTVNLQKLWTNVSCVLVSMPVKDSWSNTDHAVEAQIKTCSPVTADFQTISGQMNLTDKLQIKFSSIIRWKVERRWTSKAYMGSSECFAALSFSPTVLPPEFTKAGLRRVREFIHTHTRLHARRHGQGNGKCYCHAM